MIETLAIAQLAAAAAATPCESLSSLDIPNATIASADSIAAGPFEPPAGARRGPPRESEPLPAHCRVRMVLTPTEDSDIYVELWLPLRGWNGKFLAVGNGGWAGAIQGYGDMQEALRRGYATAATDTGHSAEDGPAGMFALGHPEKIVDFAYRAVHEMAVKSQSVIDAFYDNPIEYSYFKGCSTGGRQAVMAAQRYPDDFDGIIAGALANRHIHMHTAGAATQIHLARHPEEAISAEQAELVNDTVMAQCDTLGEGFLNNPQQCSVDFSSLMCAEGAEGTDGTCLTDAQMRTVERYFGGLKNSAGEVIFAGQAYGNPMRAMESSDEAPNPFAFDTIRILGFQDADYDWHEFDLDRDMPRIDAAAGFVDAVDPDLREFKANGGKLLLYHGWGDTGITPKNTIEYYESVLAEMGPDQDEWLRLFMVPGMGHCGGGPGPNTFDSISVLEEWREDDEAPESILARNPESGLERPLCPFPEYAQYDGSGELTDASNWTCAAD